MIAKCSEFISVSSAVSCEQCCIKIFEPAIFSSRPKLSIPSTLNIDLILWHTHCYIVSDFRFLLEIQAILPETSPFSLVQMAVFNSFFQMSIVLGMYNFESRLHRPTTNGCQWYTLIKGRNPPSKITPLSMSFEQKRHPIRSPPRLKKI